MLKRLVFVFSLLLIATPSYAAFESAPEWLALVHYQEKNGEYVSTIDSEPFFLSPDGKTNPKAELQATINLFENTQDTEKKCLFPARYKLLQKNGLISKPFPKCKDLEQFYDDLRPAGVTLLFTDAYMNNPSSLFGHTLLRIDTARKGTQLLAHGANYGAFTAGQENSVLFAIWGLTGGYFGGFTVKPYYDIINTYNNIENRDIWEFNLGFTPQELDFFVAHLWEVGHSQTRYYFFTQNCSYMLMEVLDAVRPSMRLSQQFPVQTIPLDTIKAVLERQGLVKDINYRPSRQAKIRHRYKMMNSQQKEQYLEIIHEQEYDLTGLSEPEKADVLETAYQFVQYQYVAKNLKLADYRRQSFKLLMARNKVKEQGSIAELDKGKEPYLTHDSMRAEIGTGFRNGEAFQEISYRPAYHSLTDDNYGFLRGAEINFLNATLRHYDEQNKTVLQKFDILGLRSISPMDAMFRPFSYEIKWDIAREYNPDTEDEGYVTHLKVGTGVSYALTDEIWTYAQLNSYAAYGGFLPDNAYLGLGGAIGVYADFDKWRLLSEAEQVYATDEFGEKTKLNVEGAYTLNRNNALALRYSKEWRSGKDMEESLLSWRHYF